MKIFERCFHVYSHCIMCTECAFHVRSKSLSLSQSYVHSKKIFNKQQQDQVFGNNLKFLSENIFFKADFSHSKIYVLPHHCRPSGTLYECVCVFATRGITSVCWCCSAHCTNEWMNVNFMSGSFSIHFHCAHPFCSFCAICVSYFISQCMCDVEESVYARNVSYTSSFNSRVRVFEEVRVLFLEIKKFKEILNVKLENQKLVNANHIHCLITSLSHLRKYFFKVLQWQSHKITMISRENIIIQFSNSYFFNIFFFLL